MVCNPRIIHLPKILTNFHIHFQKMDQDENDSEYGTSGYPEEHLRPMSSAPRGPPGPYRAIYSDLNDMQETKRRRIDERMEAAYDEGRLSGAPVDPADQREFIKDLFNAFNSVETEGDDAIIDKPTKHGRLSQAATKFKENRYPAYAIEEICWEIFVSRPSTLISCSFHNTNGENHRTRLESYRWM